MLSLPTCQIQQLGQWPQDSNSMAFHTLLGAVQTRQRCTQMFGLGLGAENNLLGYVQEKIK